MKHHGWLICLVLPAGLLVGCVEPSAGTSRPLGDVGYELAFTEAREVLREHFTIGRADPDTGIIECNPQPVNLHGERLLGGSNARHKARMRVRKESGGIVANLSVAVHRQGREGYRAFGHPDESSYSGVPNRTPAELEGATTPDQNEAWRTTRQDKGLEVRILGDLYRRLHPMPE